RREPRWATPASAGNEPLVGHHLANLGQARVFVRQDQFRRLQAIRRIGLPDRPDLRQQLLQRPAERAFVPRVHRTGQGGDQLVQRGGFGVVHTELTFAENPDDHVPSPARGGSADGIADSPMSAAGRAWPPLLLAGRAWLAGELCCVGSPAPASSSGVGAPPSSPLSFFSSSSASLPAP